MSCYLGSNPYASTLLIWFIQQIFIEHGARAVSYILGFKQWIRYIVSESKGLTA